MASETSPYRRLPGKKKGFLVGYHTLWQGSDHLLQIYSRFGIEDYKRFYFNDIQAIITRKTAAGRIENSVLGALSGLLGLLGVVFAGDVWSVVYAIAAGALALVLLINFFKGPTCETFLMTAVQTEKLHSLHRIKTTLSVMNRIRSLIEKRQGQINPETVDQQRIRSGIQHPSRTLPYGDKQIRREQKHEKGRAHLLLFALLIFEGLIGTASFLFNHVALTLMGSAVMMLLGICVVLALVKQHGSNLKKMLRSLTWAALGYVCFSFAVGYIISLGLAFKHPEILRNQWELFKLLSNTTPWESPLMMTAHITDLSGAVLIGIPGLFTLKNPHQAIPQPSALPAATARMNPPKRLN